MSDQGAAAGPTLHVTLDVVYSFPAPACDIALALRVRPLPRPDQASAAVRIAIEPNASTSGPVADAFGNLIDRADVAHASRLRVNADIQVAITPAPSSRAARPLPTAPPMPGELAVLSGPASTRADDDWPLILAATAERWSHDARLGRRPPLLDRTEPGESGSCEAFARLAAARLRAIAIPVRFVGGYRLGPARDAVRAVRRHAWLAVWDGGLWRECDPLDASEGSILLATAWGPTLSDLAPAAGSFRRGGEARLTVNAHATVGTWST